MPVANIYSVHIEEMSLAFGATVFTSQGRFDQKRAQSWGLSRNGQERMWALVKGIDSHDFLVLVTLKPQYTHATIVCAPIPR